MFMLRTQQINTYSADKLAKSGIIIVFVKYSSFVLYSDYIYSGLRNFIYMQGKMQNLKINYGK